MKQIQYVLFLLGMFVITTNCGDADSTTEPPAAPQPPAAGASGSAMTGVDGKATVVLGNSSVDFNVRDESGQPVSGAWALASVGDSLLLVAVADPLGRFAPEIEVASKALFSSSEESGSSLSLSRAYSLQAPDAAIAVTAGVVVLVVADLVGKALAVKEFATDPPGRKTLFDDGVLKDCATIDFADAIAVLSFKPGGGVVEILQRGVQIGLAAGEAIELLLSAAAEKYDVFKEDMTFLCEVIIGDESANISFLIISSITLAGFVAESGTHPNSPPSALYVVQPSTTGKDFYVADIHLPSGDRPVITDLAFRTVETQQGDFGLQHHQLFAVSFNDLYEVKRTTGEAQHVGSFAEEGINGLAVDQSGRLFGSTARGYLVEIDPNSSQIISRKPLGSGLASSGDLAFSPDGTLFASLKSPEGVDVLAAVDVSTGEATPRGTGIGFSDVWGLAFFKGELFGVTSSPGELIKIDTDSGLGTFVRQLTFDAFGAGGSASRAPR